MGDELLWAESRIGSRSHSSAAGSRPSTASRRSARSVSANKCLPAPRVCCRSAFSRTRARTSRLSFTGSSSCNTCSCAGSLLPLLFFFVAVVPAASHRTTSLTLLMMHLPLL